MSIFRCICNIFKTHTKCIHLFLAKTVCFQRSHIIDLKSLKCENWKLSEEKALRSHGKWRFWLCCLLCVWLQPGPWILRLLLFYICKVGLPKLIPKHGALCKRRKHFPPLTSRGQLTKRHGKTCPCAFESDSLDSFFKLIPWVGQIALQLCHIPLNGKAHWCKWRVTATPKTHCLMWRAKMMGVIASVITPGQHNIRGKRPTVFLSII